MATGYVDGDGHVMERVDEIAEMIGKANGIEGEIHPRRMVPSLDRFHTPRLQRRICGSPRKATTAAVKASLRSPATM